MYTSTYDRAMNNFEEFLEGIKNRPSEAADAIELMMRVTDQFSTEQKERIMQRVLQDVHDSAKKRPPAKVLYERLLRSSPLFFTYSLYIQNADAEENQRWLDILAGFERNQYGLETVIEMVKKERLPPIHLLEQYKENVLINQLEELTGKPVSEWKKLERIILSNNKLTSLPLEVEEWKNLVSLSLKGNQLTSLPSEVGGWKNLLEIALDNNQLETLPPEIAEWKKLEILYLSNNKIKSFPEEIRYLNKLKTINLYKNEGLLRDEIDKLKNLLPNCQIYHD